MLMVQEIFSLKGDYALFKVVYTDFLSHLHLSYEELLAWEIIPVAWALLLSEWITSEELGVGDIRSPFLQSVAIPTEDSRI